MFRMIDYFVSILFDMIALFFLSYDILLTLMVTIFCSHIQIRKFSQSVERLLFNHFCGIEIFEDSIFLKSWYFISTALKAAFICFAAFKAALICFAHTNLRGECLARKKFHEFPDFCSFLWKIHPQKNVSAFSQKLIQREIDKYADLNSRM